jgi:hypothetical protein
MTAILTSSTSLKHRPPNPEKLEFIFTVYVIDSLPTNIPFYYAYQISIRFFHSLAGGIIYESFYFYLWISKKFGDMD